MPNVTETAPPRTPGGPVVVERRRPGRPKTVNPNLIPILRNPAGALMIPGHDTPGDRHTSGDFFDRPRLDHLALRGIAIALVLAIPLWGAVGFVVGWLLRP